MRIQRADKCHGRETNDADSTARRFVIGARARARARTTGISTLSIRMNLVVAAGRYRDLPPHFARTRRRGCPRDRLRVILDPFAPVFAREESPPQRSSFVYPRGHTHVYIHTPWRGLAPWQVSLPPRSRPVVAT